MRMKRIIFSLSLLLFMPGMYGQTGHITLEECQQKTQDNYPLVRQYDLVEKTKEYNLENAARGYLPQFALSAKASYQSDVTELPIAIPGVDIKGMAKDQYQVMLELQDAVKVEQLNTRQKRVELTSSRMAYLKMLSLLMGEVLSTETVLEKPVPQNELSAVSEIRRPELSWFDAQGAVLQVQEKALNVRHLPHFGLFVQGAYGNPGLNMLKNEFSPYYIAGVRLSWNFGSLYTLKNDRRVIENKRQQLDSNRDVFLFNTRLEMTQQDQSVRSLEKQMQDDDEIIRLRTNIRRAAEAKVANGTLTVTEMLRELTNESLARQAKAMHEIQRLMGIYQLKYTTNH